MFEPFENVVFESLTVGVGDLFLAWKKTSTSDVLAIVPSGTSENSHWDAFGNPGGTFLQAYGNLKEFSCRFRFAPGPKNGNYLIFGMAKSLNILNIC